VKYTAASAVAAPIIRDLLFPFAINHHSLSLYIPIPFQTQSFFIMAREEVYLFNFLFKN